MKVKSPPAASYAFGYKKAPVSGNKINGHQQREKRRASHVFHNAGNERLPWDALDTFFSYITIWPIVLHIVANVWQLRRQTGPVNSNRISVTNPETMARQIKEKAQNLGAELVGITLVTEDVLFEGTEVNYKHAICIGLSMNRDEMIHAPHPRAGIEVMRIYRKIGRIAIELAEYIRAMGWPARAYGNPNSTDILHIPLAIKAGLGQLGKHGSLISKEFGSNFRLAAVLTDIPLAADKPVDIAVDDVCMSCRRCVLDCPPDAIFNDKQLVRGEKKWYVDFDKCIPYFVKTNGCAICIEVCPWSEPGRGHWLVEKMMAKRTKDDLVRKK